MFRTLRCPVEAVSQVIATNGLRPGFVPLKKAGRSTPVFISADVPRGALAPSRASGLEPRLLCRAGEQQNRDRGPRRVQQCRTSRARSTRNKQSACGPCALCEADRSSRAPGASAAAQTTASARGRSRLRPASENAPASGTEVREEEPREMRPGFPRQDVWRGAGRGGEAGADRRGARSSRQILARMCANPARIAVRQTSAPEAPGFLLSEPCRRYALTCAEIQEQLHRPLCVSWLWQAMRCEKKQRRAAPGGSTRHTRRGGVLLPRSTRLRFHLPRQLGQHPRSDCHRPLPESVRVRTLCGEVQQRLLESEQARKFGHLLFLHGYLPIGRSSDFLYPPASLTLCAKIRETPAPPAITDLSGGGEDEPSWQAT